MRDRARSGIALMVVVSVVLGILIGTRNLGRERVASVSAPAAAPEAVPASTTTGAHGGAAPGGDSDADGAQGAEDPDDFFSQYRLDRSRTRSRTLETLRQIIADSETSEEARAAASSQLVDISTKTEAEAETEALIKARGYEDALVFLTDSGCDVIVLGRELSRADAEQIGDIVSRHLGVDLSKITILER